MRVESCVFGDNLEPSKALAVKGKKTSNFSTKMWLKLLRQNIAHLARRSKGSASVEQTNGNANTKGNKTNNNGTELNRNEDENGSADKLSAAKKKPVVPGGLPLIQQTEISTSQLDFFRMLDEKIENGPDYDENTECQNHIERVSGLVRRWELASSAEGSSTNLHQQQQQQQINNNINNAHRHYQATTQSRSIPIVGSAASTFSHTQQRTYNRLDGLKDMQNSPSPNMPRHVLESISQSPTQGLLRANVTPNFLNDDFTNYRDNNQASLQYRSANLVISSSQPQQQQFFAGQRKRGYSNPTQLT